MRAAPRGTQRRYAPMKTANHHKSLQLLLHACMFVSLCMATASTAIADESAVQRLHDAFNAEEYETFDQVLSEGTIDSSEFGQDPKAYKVLCLSTHPARLEYLNRLIDFGVDPSVRDPEGASQTAVPLICAAREYSPTSFELLLDAGADSEISTCLTCEGSHYTLVAQLARDPELLAMIFERRELNSTEMDGLARYIERFYIHKTFNGKPVGEYYAEYLQERGQEVTPKGPRKRTP